jgi:hypothetical protein
MIWGQCGALREAPCFVRGMAKNRRIAFIQGDDMSFKQLSRRSTLFALAAGSIFPALASARAEHACGEGLVILTVGGLAGASNRKPFDANRDRFFDHNNLNFQQARTFSSAELAALPQSTVEAHVYGSGIVAKGPSLREILAAASPLSTAKTARLSALDGYAAEIALDEIQSQRWILATEADGKPFAIGDFGPLYAMRQLPAGEPETEEESNKWVHSLYYIELMS